MAASTFWSDGNLPKQIEMITYAEAARRAKKRKARKRRKRGG